MAKRGLESFTDFEQRIHDRLERAYQSLFGRAPGSPNFGARYIEPPVDVYETDTHVIVLMEIAGILEEEIELEAEGRSMVIRGERRPIPGRAHRVYSQMEIINGPFQRELFLPAEVNPEKAEAVYKHGILEIVLPKASPARGRQLRIMVR